MRRQKYFDELLDMFMQHIEEKDYRTELEIQEKILTFIEENPIPEEDGDMYDPYLGDGNFADNH